MNAIFDRLDRLAKENKHFRRARWSILTAFFSLAVGFVFFQFFFAASDVYLAKAGVSSVQSGTVSMSTTPQTVSLTAVDLSKSFVQCYFETNSSNASNASTCQLTDPTTLTITSGATNASLNVHYYVIEFADGVSVQRGSTSFGTGDTTVNETLSPFVDTTKAFVLSTSRTTSTSQTLDEQRTIGAQLTSGTNLELSRNESGIAVDVEWQVIQIDGANVISGSTQITDTNTSNTVNFSAVDLSRSFLVLNTKADAATNGVDNEYYVRGTLTNSTTATFNRAGSVNDVDINYFVVELPSGNNVQSGSLSAATTETNLNTTLAPTVDLNRTIPFISTQVIEGGNPGGTADQDSGSWAPTLAAGQIDVDRGSTQDRPSTVDWFTVEFEDIQPVIDWSSCRVEGGTTTIAAASATQDVTLSTSVSDLSKAFLLVDSTGTSGVQGGNDHMVSGFIFDANTLRFERGLATPGAAAEVGYALVECFNDEFTVQRGEITITGGSTTGTSGISSVTTGNSMVIVSSRTDDTGNAEDEALVTGELQDATTVLATRAATGSATNVRYEVVEFSSGSGVSVQTGEVTLGSGSASVTDTISSVDLGESWLYCSWDATNNGLQQTAVGCDLTNSTTVTFNRFASSAFTNRIRYYVIDFNSADVTAQQASQFFNADAEGCTDNTQCDQDIAITAVNAVTKAFPFVTNTTSGTGTAFPRNKWIEYLTSTTNLRTTNYRSVSGQAFDDNTKYWQVIEFAPAGPNAVPTGSFNTTSGNTGGINVSIEVDDPDDDFTRARIEYETDLDGSCNGPWSNATLSGPSVADYEDSGGPPDISGLSYQIGSSGTTRIITSSGSNTVDFTWDSATDLPGQTGTACLRLTVNDDTADQTTPDTITFAVDNGAMVTQNTYRWFENDDSTDVGDALAAQDTLAVLTASNQEVRLRMSLEPDALISPSGKSFKLQFAQQGSDALCDASFVGESYADITGVSDIAYFDNATPADADAITTNANDPTDGGTMIAQTYEESNNFTNSAAIASGEDGLWDFSLVMNGAELSSAYCIRAVSDAGSTLATYDVIPELETMVDVYLLCDGANELHKLNTTTGARTVIGGTGVGAIEAIAYDSAVPALYAADAGNFGTLDTSTGTFTFVAEIDGGGCADGGAGCIALNDVDGLALDGQTRILWASHRTGGGTSDLLFQIDPGTGQFIPDAFGPGVDYLEIGGTGVYNLIDDIAIRPDDGKIYTTGNDGVNDQILTINKSTGAITVVTAIDTTDFEGSDFRNDNVLMGVRGFSDEYREIDEDTGVTSNIISLSSPACGDPEGIAAMTRPPNRITGTVFQDDTPQNGIFDGGESGIQNVTVRLFDDLNMNGVVDGTDTFLQETTTDINGEYLFYYYTTGDLALEIDTGTLPAGFALTTDNYEAATFTDAVNFNETDPDNNFGANTGGDCDGNGIPDFIEGTGDTDGDGVTDDCDLDNDNDGIDDSIEGTNDRDEDGVLNLFDLDSDNDGIPDAIEANGGSAPTGYSSATGRITGTDGDGDGLLDSVDSLPATMYGASTTTLPLTDTDGSVPDYLDGDSDDDGLMDIIEAGGVDSDGDSFVDSFTDTNSDGYHDPLTTTPLAIPNTDGTGGFDYQDSDSDGDGIPDFREGQSETYFIPGFINDTDGDGIIDAFDSGQGGTAHPATDTDGDGTPDYQDLNSDNDGVPDSIEGHDADFDGVADVTPAGTDTDGDGIDDNFDTVSSPSQYFDNNTGVNTPAQNFDATDNRDWRDDNDDNDGFDTVNEDFNTNLDYSDDFTQGCGPANPDYYCFTQPVDIQVDKTVDDPAPDEGDTVVFTVTVTNNGPVTATSVSVDDDLPGGVTYVSDNPSQGSYVPATGIWSIGTMLNGASETIDFTVTVDSGTAGTTITNTGLLDFVLQGDSNSANDTDNSGINVVGADLDLVKVVDDANPDEGDTIVYTLTLSNSGPDTATNIDVTDSLPSGVTYVSHVASSGSYVPGTGIWDVPLILSGNNVTLDITATVDAGQGGNTIDNDAEVTAVDQDDPDSTPNNSSGTEDDEDTASISVSSADLSFTKTVDDSSPSEGDTITYTLTVTNGGPSNATNVVVSDSLPAGVTYVSDVPSQGTYTPGTGLWSVGTIANGLNATLDINVTVDVGQAGNTINNAAEVDSVDQGDPDSTPGNTSGSEDDEDDVDITVVSADLELTKVVDDSNPNVGDTITYTITVNNNGPDNATNVVVTDALPSGVTYVSDTPSQGSYVSGTGVWTVGTINNGANATLDVSVSIDGGEAGSAITNGAEVTGVDQGDPDSTANNGSTTEDDDDAVTVNVQSADLELTKTASVSDADEGDTVTYTLTLVNNGPDTAENITVTDLLPAGVTYVSDTPSQGSYVNGTGIWTVGTILNAGNATLTIDVTVDNGTAGQTINNSAEVTSVDQGDPDSTAGNGSTTEDDDDSDSFMVNDADLEVVKTVDDNNPNVGDTITYTLTVTNNGPNNATGVEVTDLLPSGVTYVSDTPSQGSYVDGTGVWTIGALPNGNNVTLDIVATVDAGEGGNTINNAASITDVDQGDGTPGNNDDDIDIIVQASDLSLTKVVDDAFPDEGDTITFTITVANGGPDDADNIVVTDLLPAGFTYTGDTPSQGSYVNGTGVWTVGTVNNGANATLDITASVDGGTAGSSIVNAAEVTSVDQEDPDSTPGNTSGSEDDEDTVTVNIFEADLSLTKVVDDANPGEGDTITYTITVSNAGPNDATNVIVDDDLPAGVTYVSDTPSQGTYTSGTGQWVIGTITNGGNATLDIVATVDGGTQGTTINNAAEVDASDVTDPDSTPGNTSGSEDDEDDVDITVESADLDLAKVVDDSTPTEGDTITFTLTVSNSGPDTANNVVVTDALPAGLTYVSDTPSQGSYVSGTGVWTVGTINNGANATLDVVATVDSGTGDTIITNSAEITGVDEDDPDSTPNNGSTTEDDDDSVSLDIQEADLDLAKVVSDSTPNVGDTITYTITVSNSGPDSATNVQVTDVLPAGLTYSSDTPSQGSYVPGTGVWTVGTIANGANATLDIDVTVDTGTGADTLDNSAEITASDIFDPDSTPNNGSTTEDDDDTTSITIQESDLSLTKVVDNATPNEGDTVTYTITVTNGGPDNATNLIIEDLLPAGLTYVSDTPSQGSYVNGTGLWTVGTVNNGANATLDIVATVDGGTLGTIITNIAQVNDVDQEDPDSTPDNDNGGEDDQDDAPIDIQAADLDLTKTVDDASPNVGDTITFTITVTNSGPDDATNVVVTDQLPSGLTYVSDTPSQGSYVSGTGVWTVGTINNGANATLDIVATVDGGEGGNDIDNDAEVTSVDQSDPDSTPGNTSGTEDDEDTQTIDVQGVDIEVSKVVDDSTPNETDTITYTITVTNNGPDTATGISINDDLPVGVTYSSDTPSQGTYTSGTGIWAVGSLANGANATLDIDATVDTGTAASTLNNIAELVALDQEDSDSTPNNGLGAEDDQDNAEITVQGADLSLTKSVDDTTPNVGDTVTYTITVNNGGPDSATNVSVTDSLPSGVTYVSDTPSQGSYVPGTGIWTIGTIANGGNATLDIDVTIDGGESGNTIINNAEIETSDQADGDSTPGNTSGIEDDEDAVSLTVEQADLSLTKIVSDNSPNEGDTITYTLTVTNGGPDAATNLIIEDVLPSGVTYVSDTPSQGSYVNGTGLWTVGTVNNGANATLDIVVTVDAATQGSSIDNDAEVNSVDQEDPDSTPDNDSGTEDDEDTATITIESADLSLTKGVSDSSPNVGDTITYTLTLANAGPDNATNIVVTDLLPSGVTYVSDTPSQGSYVNGTGIWTVGTLNNGANATLTITATVDVGTGADTIDNDAEVTSVDQDDPDSTPGNTSGSEDDEDDASITVQEADLSLTKVVDDSSPNETDTITYTITVTNNGPDSATNVTVNDDLPSGVSYSSDTPSQGTYTSGTGIWDIGTLTNGQVVTLDIVGTVDVGTAASTIQNAAEVVTSDQEDPDSTPGNTSGSEDDEDTADITVQGADLSLTKTVDDSTPNVGDSITYTITVNNGGPDSATNVTVRDVLPAGLTYVSDTPSQGSYVNGTGIWTIGTILNGGSPTLDIVATVDAGQSGNTINNEAEVETSDQADGDSTPGNGSGVEDDEDDVDITVEQADLSLTKVVDDSSPNEGDTITYTLTVTNGGPDAATNVVIEDVLPSGVTYVSDTPSQGSYVNGTGLWTVGTVNNGANATLDIVATVDAATQGSSIDNDAEVNSVDQEDPDSTPDNDSGTEDDEDTATISIESADLSLTKTVDDATPNEGDTVTFTITVSNGGPDAADNVTVTDLLPAGLTYTGDTPSQGSYVNGTGVWTIGTINNGANATLDITATVDAGQSGNTIDNDAEVTSADQDDPDSTPGNTSGSEDDEDDASITVEEADLSLTKTVDDSSPNEGDTITYTLTVTNGGPDAATNIVIEDVLPSGVTYVSDTPSQGSYVNGTGLWSVGTVNNGANATLDIVATVDTGTAASTIQNAAEVDSVDQADPDSTPGNTSGTEDDEDTADITVQGADLSLTKTVNDSTPNVGDTVTYTITLTNGGPDNATNIIVEDVLPSGMTYVSDTPSQGSYASGTGLWTVGTVNNGANATLTIDATIDAGEAGNTIDNIAQVNAVDQADGDSTPDNDVGAEDDQDNAELTVQSADLELTKIADDNSPNEGDTVMFTITVSNNGPDNATNVVVTDLLPAGVTYVSDTPSQGSYVNGTGIWTVGTINNGANATLDIEVTVDSGTAGTTIDNDAEVDSVDQEDPDSTPGNTSGSEDDEDTASLAVESADLSLTKTVDDSTPNVGDTITYTITVSNAGPQNATNITVDDILPAGLTYVSNTPSQGTYTPGTGEWDVGVINNGANATLDISATIDAGQGGNTINNAAEVTAADQADPDSTPGNTSGTEDDEDDVDIIVESADIVVTKVVDNGTPTVGDTITYTITVTNNGPDTATSLEVTDSLPAGLTYVSDTPSQGSYISGTGIWTIGSINNGANATLQISASVDTGTGGTIIGNTATLTNTDQEDPNPGDEDDDEDIDVQSADLEVVKTVDDATPNVGDTITYTITVTNNGPDNTTGVELTDNLPAGLTYVSDTPSQGTYTPGTGIWNIGALNNGANVTLDIVATVDIGEGGNIIGNTATITDTDVDDPNPGDDSDDEDIDVPGIDVELDISVDDSAPAEGGTVNYTITVTNNGPDTGTNITVDAPIPAGVTYVSDTPSQGTFTSGTGEWDIGSMTNGQVVTLQIEVTVDAGQAGNTISYPAEVETHDEEDGDSNPGNTSGVEDDEDSVDISVELADLSLAKIVDQNNPDEGDTVTYTLTINNAGPSIATGVEVSDLLPTGVTFIGATPSIGTYTSGTGVWDIGTLNIGNETLDIQVSIDNGTEGDTITNITEVSLANELDPDSTPGNTSGTEDDEDEAELEVDTPGGGGGGGGGGGCAPILNAGILINNDALTTASRDVELNLSYIGATTVLISEDPTFADAIEQPVETLKLFTLSAGAGVKTVYAQFKSNCRTTQAVFDDIILVEDPTELPPPLPPIPSPPAPPVLEECPSCDRLSYDLWIINPDGSERHSNTEWTIIEEISPGIQLVRFEDKGEDFDHNDVLVEVDLRNCENIRFTYVGGDAAWSHQVRFTVFVDGIEKSEVLVWNDSQEASGQSRTVNARNLPGVCSEVPVKITPDQCSLDCSRLDYDLYIINPNGTERHSNTVWTIIEEGINGIDTVYFEDKGEDFDHNDVIVTVDRSNCENIRFQHIGGDAAWSHEIRFTIFVDGKAVSDFQVFDDSQSSMGASTSLQLETNPLVCEAILDIAEEDGVPFGGGPVRGVTLYEHVNYGGRFQTFLSDEVDLRQTEFGHDIVSSIRVFGGASIILYEHILFGGAEELFQFDDPDLRDNFIGQDVVSSLIIRQSSAFTPISGEPVSCTTPVFFEEFLTPGDETDEVLALQELLQCLGFFDPDIEPNGFYGPATEAAVLAFQAENGIDTFGYVGPGTRAALNLFSEDVEVLEEEEEETEEEPERLTPDPLEDELIEEIAEEIVLGNQCSTSRTFTSFLIFDVESDEVLDLQELLLCLGYFDANIEPNGNFGPATEAAVTAFQEANSIDPFGYVGPATRAALNEYSQ